MCSLPMKGSPKFGRWLKYEVSPSPFRQRRICLGQKSSPRRGEEKKLCFPLVFHGWQASPTENGWWVKNVCRGEREEKTMSDSPASGSSTSLTALSSTLHFVLRLSVEGRLRPEGNLLKSGTYPTYTYG